LPRTVEEGDNGQTIEVAIGDTVEVRLPETASTGFRWHVVSSGDPVCAIAADTRVPPGSAKPGAPGVHQWRLEARKAGDGEFKLAYRRFWESGDAGREFTIRVRVVPK